jgi:hypothetical protein
MGAKVGASRQAHGNAESVRAAKRDEQLPWMGIQRTAQADIPRAMGAYWVWVSDGTNIKAKQLIIH